MPRRCYSLPAATKYHQLRCFYGATFFAVCFVVGNIVVVGFGAADVVSAFAVFAFAVAAETRVVAFAVEASNNVVDEWRSTEFVMVANSSCCCYRTDRSLYSYLSSRSSFSYSLCYCRS